LLFTIMFHFFRGFPVTNYDDYYVSLMDRYLENEKKKSVTRRSLPTIDVMLQR